MKLKFKIHIGVEPIIGKGLCFSCRYDPGYKNESFATHMICKRGEVSYLVCRPCAAWVNSAGIKRL